ncbi:MAG TPA: right-handed parallel beta-helix repeat-containing protein [Thermoanaerobaculia bacterium]|nr:right-handed parallel beta-helix repeat-containing protein [Thermoanaerobaculia bacterium]
MRRALYAVFVLSLAAAAAGDVYLVTNTSDSGIGSLRQAILDANAHPGPDEIHFNIPPAPAQFGINAGSPYVITSPVVIDATSQGLHLPITFAGNDDGFVYDAGSDGSVLRHLQIGGISSIDHAAIRITGGTGITVADNTIGVIDNGTGNRIGVLIATNGNTIGGTSAADRNVISGNNIGIQIEGGVFDNRVEGNHIGVDREGTVVRANTEAGVVLFNARGNTIGGLTAGTRNVIAGSPVGVHVATPSFGNTIAGNYIGINAFGEGSNPDLRNGQGVLLGGLGENLVTLNVISNNGTGILVTEGFNQQIKGNVVGMDPERTRAIPNGSGIVVLPITDVRDLRIGGALPDEGNHVAGNTDDGIRVESFSVIYIEGNIVGVNEIGAIPNGTGIRLNASENTTVGGPISSAGNVVSGNRGDGIVANGGVIVSNLIGLAEDGTTAVPNNGNGITAVGTGAVQIGQNGAGNLIAFNRGFGIDIGGTANVGARSIEFNSIRNNAFAGVRVRDNARHTIRRNSITRNGGLGIDLAGDGVTLNDTGDPDSGPNLRQNFPVLTGFSVAGSQLSVRGTFNGAANQTFTLDFYRNLETDLSGFGEGETYLGTTTITTNAFGDATFTATLPAAETSLRYISATATDASGNTSEFSRDLFIGPSGPPKRRSARH